MCYGVISGCIIRKKNSKEEAFEPRLSLSQLLENLGKVFQKK